MEMNTDARMSSSVNRTFSFANNTRHVRQSCELKLETTPRNAQYSQKVTDLMRREEVRVYERVWTHTVLRVYAAFYPRTLVYRSLLW